MYQAIRAQLNIDERILFDSAINIKNEIKINKKKIRCIYGLSIDDLNNPDDLKSFVLIFSNAVLEHIPDIDKAFQVMDHLITKGGYLVHKVDLRDHGLFSSYDLHPLTFLTIPEPLHRMMTTNTMSLNRQLISYYRKKLIELKYNSKIYISHIVGQNYKHTPYKEKILLNIDYSDDELNIIKTIRKKLIPEYRNLPEKELLISGILIVAKKL